MPIALVTGGESARTSYSDDLFDGYEAVVAANWASHHYRSRWIVALDPTVWRIEHISRIVLPIRGLVSYETQPQDVTDILEAEDIELRPFGSRITHRVKGICTFTFPYALRFCLETWPDSRVDIYGLDMDDRKGLQPGGPPVRKPGPRWNNEEPFTRAIFYEHGKRINLIECKVDPGRLRKGESVQWEESMK